MDPGPFGNLPKPSGKAAAALIGPKLPPIIEVTHSPAHVFNPAGAECGRSEKSRTDSKSRSVTQDADSPSSPPVGPGEPSILR